MFHIWFISYAYGRFFHLKNSIWSSILTNVLFEDRFLSSNLVQWLFFFFKTSLILVLINYKVKPKGLNSNFLPLPTIVILLHLLAPSYNIPAGMPEESRTAITNSQTHSNPSKQKCYLYVEFCFTYLHFAREK